MRTTTTVWRVIEEDMNDEAGRTRFHNNRTALAAAAAEIAGSDLYKEPVSGQFSEDGLFFTTVRAWPDLAAAEAWVSFCTAKSANELFADTLVSSVVDPE